MLYRVLCGLAHLCDDGGSSASTKLATFMDDAEADVLAFMSAGSKFVGHVVVLTCKFVLRTDRVRTSKKQVCEKWTNGRLLRIPEFPNSLIPAKKFPVL